MAIRAPDGANNESPSVKEVMRKLNNAGELVRAIEGRWRERSSSDVEGTLGGACSSFAPKA